MTNEGEITGGGFLIRQANPDAVFVPEAFGADARLMARTADEFLRREALPQTERIESHDLWLMERLMRRAGELGLLSADVPEIYGGLGLDVPTAALLAEKLNWQQSFALTHEAHTVIATLPLLFFGSHAQKAKYLPKLASGEWIGSFCLSEPGSGSDALAAQTRATLSQDGTRYVLNGTKAWVTNAAFAQLFTVFAKVDGKHFSCFLVERDTPGLTLGKEEQKLGMRGTSTRRLTLEEASVPIENRVGAVGHGHRAAFCALNMGRFKLEAGAVGGLKETLATCASYAQERKQFGKPLGSFGLIRHKLAEMAARTYALESAVYRLAGDLDALFQEVRPEAIDAPERYHHAAEEFAPECGIVKVYGSELYSWATDEAIQIHGGNGYTEEFPVARAWRDQRLLRIGEGANEVVRVNIVSQLSKRACEGRLHVGEATNRAAALGPGDFGPSSPAGSPWSRLKIAALLLLDAARAAFENDLFEEQEVVAAIADLVVSAYVVESAALRSARLARMGTGEKARELVSLATTIVGETALEEGHRSAHLALCRVAETAKVSDRIRETLIALFFARESPCLITLRRQLAIAVLDRNGYPFGT